MARKLPPRIIRSGPYIPTTSRTGDGDFIWRKRNLITRARGGRIFEEQIKGSESRYGVPTSALTGILTSFPVSNLVTGIGTFFKRECHLGQRIVIEDGSGHSDLLVPRRIFDDTNMEVWKAVSVNYVQKTAYRLPRLFPLNDQVGSLLWGNSIQLDKGTLLTTGTGVLRIDGQTLTGGSLTATRQPKISIHNPTTGNYSSYTLGMNTPSAPSLTAVAGGTKGQLAGLYTIRITPHRGATQGYNNPSVFASVTITAGQKIRIDFPTEDTTNGQDAWGIWVSLFRGTVVSDQDQFNGPWFYYDTVLVSALSGGSGGTFDVEWLDHEVEGNEMLSYNNDQPPEAEFVELLDFKPIFVSCRGKGYVSNAVTFTDPAPGPFIAPAKPNNIEAAPIEIQFSSSPPETIIGALKGEGRLYLLTHNSLQIAEATGNDTVPVIIRPFWSDGFAAPEQLVFMHGALYGYTTGGPARSSGEGVLQEADKSWAADVTEITGNWTPGHVLVAYDPYYDCIVYFHNADRLNSNGFWTTRYLMYSLSQQQWVGDGELSTTNSDRILGGVTTVGDTLHFSAGGRT